MYVFVYCLKLTNRSEITIIKAHVFVNYANYSRIDDYSRNVGARLIE